jgi:hypothetical protein
VQSPRDGRSSYIQIIEDFGRIMKSVQNLAKLRIGFLFNEVARRSAFCHIKSRWEMWHCD